ncbi:MAG TPA: glycosyltransferase [Allosphingosinicella sp.]
MQSSGEANGLPVVAIFRSPLFHAHETFVRTHVLGLRRYRPLVIGLEDRGHVPPGLEGRIILPGSGAEALRLRLLRPGRAFAERVRAHAPRLMHAHFAPDGLLALPLALRLGIPLVTTLHGYDVSRRRSRLVSSGRLSWIRYGLFGGRLRARGRLFLAVSDALRAQALAAGFPPERTVTHYNGVDLARFPRPARPPERGLILHVGRLVEKKGSAVLIRALAEVREARPDARLVVLGEGPLRPRLEAQAAALGLSAHVSFLGARSSEEVAAWMARAWLLAVPSVTAGDGDSEGLPTVLQEAAAASLPAVGSRHSGIVEAIEDGVSGFLVPEGEAAPLARRISDLLEAPRLRASMARESRAIAETRFDSARQNQLLENLYDRLINSPDLPL